MKTMKKAELLFDFQKIAKNKRLENLIKSTETKYNLNSQEYELSDEELDVFAAGDIFSQDAFSAEDNENE